MDLLWCLNAAAIRNSVIPIPGSKLLFRVTRGNNCLWVHSAVSSRDPPSLIMNSEY